MTLRDALDYFEQEWQLNGRPYLWDAAKAIESRPVLLAAARRVAEAPEVWWCEVHEAEGSDIACWKRYTQYPRLPSGQDCEMVRKLLVDPPEENHAAGS